MQMYRDRRRRVQADTRRHTDGDTARADAVPAPAPTQATAGIRVEPSNRHRALWILLGLVGLGSITYVHLTSGPHHLLTFHRDADKIEHVVAFGAAMLWFGQLYRRGIEGALFCICLILGGVALEYIQHALGHYDPVEYGDMAADALGAGLGLLLLRTRMANIIASLDRWLAQRGAGRRSAVRGNEPY